ncbi:MAG: hypothetical protein Q9186_000105 [Xanthomendoza sp. 1 TL-2023]
MTTQTDERTSNSSIKSEIGEEPARSDFDNDPVYSYEEQRAIIHRIDRRLVVTLGLIYVVAQIDRGNLVDTLLSDDVGKRYFLFYVIGCVALAFGGILAYGLMQMDGISGKSGWRWIFIMEGIVCTLNSRQLSLRNLVIFLTLLKITCAASSLVYLFLVDFPDKADQSWRFLNKDERDFIIRRINKDRDDATVEPFTFGRFFKPARNIEIWVFALISFVAASQCLIAPPYALAALLMALSAYLGDHYHIRGPILIANALITLIGLPIVGFAPSAAVRYFGVFLVTAGINANIPVALAYQANNVRGQWKRAFCSVLFVGLGGVGGISGATIFRSQDAPRYIPGISAAIA